MVDSEILLSIKKTRFTESFIHANGLRETGFGEWVFLPGMLFQAPDKWWGNPEKRDKPHEGLDLYLYRDRKSRIRHLENTTRIPAMYRGVVVKILDDFLGKSVIMKHVQPDNKNIKTFTIFGHTQPVAGLEKGTSFDQGDIITCLADTAKPNAMVAPHLHISAGWSSKPIPQGDLNWKTIGTSNAPTLFNPLDMIDWRYTVLDDDKVISRDL